MSIVTFGETPLRLSTQNGERFETAHELSLSGDGIASNAAAVAGRLGGDAVWLSKVPDSPLGRRVVAELHEHGLETEVVWADTDESRQGLSFYEDASAPREARLLHDRGDAAMGTVTPGELPVGRIQKADIVFTTGSTAAVSDRAEKTTSALLRSADGIRALDLDFHPDIWSAESARETLATLFDAVDVLFASEQQATAVFDQSGKPRELVHLIASEFEFTHVILTREERGVVGYNDGVVHEQDHFETEIVDAAGEHAAFIGAALQQLAAGAPTDKALTYGRAAAALTRTMPGPLTPIESEEVDRLVASTSSKMR